MEDVTGGFLEQTGYHTKTSQTPSEEPREKKRISPWLSATGREGNKDNNPSGHPSSN